jgi:hypothetical protein
VFLGDLDVSTIRLASSLPLLVLLACGGLPPAAPAPPPVSLAPAKPTAEEACRDAARACSDAVAGIAGLNDDQIEHMVSCMADEAVALNGGHDALIAALKNQTGLLENAASRTVERTDVDLPDRVVRVGEKLFAIVPKHYYVRDPQGLFVVHGYVIGVSKDGGASWKFVRGADLTPASVRLVFPDFPSGLALPEVPPPESLSRHVL